MVAEHEKHQDEQPKDGNGPDDGNKASLGDDGLHQTVRGVEPVGDIQRQCVTLRQVRTSVMTAAKRHESITVRFTRA